MSVGREVLRGKPLDADCLKANISKHEYGKNDNRCFCYGLENPMNDEVLPKCEECGAYVYNAKPPKERSDGMYDLTDFIIHETDTRNKYRKGYKKRI